MNEQEGSLENYVRVQKKNYVCLLFFQIFQFFFSITIFLLQVYSEPSLIQTFSKE